MFPAAAVPETSGFVEQLRDAGRYPSIGGIWALKAADHITALETRLREVEGALRAVLEIDVTDAEWSTARRLLERKP